MRVFFRSAPIFMALSVALAGCSESDAPAAKSPTPTVAKPPADTTVAAVNPNATEVCMTVEGMT
jgi:hypothetical protein